MSSSGPGESTSNSSRVKPEGGFLDLLHAVALIAVVAGAAGSVGLMLRAGHPPLFLRVLFVIWVLSPFMALLLADKVSKRWSLITRATLHSVMLIVTLGSLVIYGGAALRPPASKPAFLFLVVPLGSWLLMAIVVPMAALISGRQSLK
jgi:hypothetical protein